MGKFAFYECHKMNIVEFEENSEMEIIDYSDFSNSSIQIINIPPNCHVKTRCIL